MFTPATPCPYCEPIDYQYREGFGTVAVRTTCSRCNGTRYLPQGEEELRTIVITGSGDVELGARLCQKYGCAGLIAPLAHGQYAYGYLHMTMLSPKDLILVKGVEIIPVDEAIKELL